jgi:hypothetical protein
MGNLVIAEEGRTRKWGKVDVTEVDIRMMAY